MWCYATWKWDHEEVKVAWWASYAAHSRGASEWFDMHYKNDILLGDFFLNRAYEKCWVCTSSSKVARKVGKLFEKGWRTCWITLRYESLSRVSDWQGKKKVLVVLICNRWLLLWDFFWGEWQLKLWEGETRVYTNKLIKKTMGAPITCLEVETYWQKL